ncbi:hypothetical protein [Marmoricola endophyticus]|nr:hypothetical protein [Marmoricola endophyticus]
MDDGRWRERARLQAGMLGVWQLSRLGVTRSVMRHKLATERWGQHTDRVLATTTGEPTLLQRQWLGVLHAGRGSLVGGVSAAENAGLRGWSRDHVTVLVDDEWSFDPVPGIEFFRTRRPLRDLRGSRPGRLPVCQLEPAVLLFAAYDPSVRTAQGIVAAVVQQRLTTPEALTGWIERLRPLRRARLFRRVLLDVAGGAQSLAEIDVRRMCRTHRLPPPTRQRPRRDREGRLRYTDCEWALPDGRTLVLEVDGAFHADVLHWGADMRRQRKLATSVRIVVRCSAIELRDEPEAVAEDLVALGVRSCAGAVARATTAAHDSTTGP